MTAEQQPVLTILYMYCQLLYFHLICLQTNLTAFDKLLAIVYSNCSNLGPYHVLSENVFLSTSGWSQVGGTSCNSLLCLNCHFYQLISMFNMTNSKQLSMKRDEVLALHLVCNW